MSDGANKQTLGFQAEVKQLLHLMVHSLYSNKEIFLRELISNASDALDRLRFEAISKPELMGRDPELTIRIEFDQDEGTLAISDNGIGMSREELVDQLGTIAKSGTAQFLEQLTGDEKKDSKLIGQFGVGFYSSFIVASRVEVLSRRAGLGAEEAVHWESDGEGQFSVESLHKPDRGTKVILHLKDAEKEFADAFRLRHLIRTYSDHIAFPVQMVKEAKEDRDEKLLAEYETVNTATALWTRPRQDIEDEEYKEFYKHISHDFEEPLSWSHNRVEGKREYTSLLFIPRRAPFDIWNREASRGLKLYVQRVFIMDEVQQFLPLYLRFVRGIVDSNDLSLNVSREILQKDPTVEAIRSALVKRVLDMLGKLAKQQPEEYQIFWKELGQVLKEGPAEDLGNKDKIAGLLRFSTTHTGEAAQDQSLADYIGRMKEGQDKIYYVVADSHGTAANSPHLEVFRDKGIEVLLLSDRIDDWLMHSLSEFDGKPFSDVARGALDLGAVETDEEKEQKKQDSEEHRGLTKKIKTVLRDRVKEVRVTRRLTDSPACLVVDEQDVGAHMRRLMQSAGQPLPDTKPIFEINPEHPLVAKLEAESSDDRFGDLAMVLFEQANLAEGGQLSDPGGYVKRLNKLLLELSQ